MRQYHQDMLLQAGGDAGETIELLWGRICLHQGLLGPFLRALCQPPLTSSEAWADGGLDALHILTLHVLAEEAQSTTETAKPAGCELSPLVLFSPHLVALPVAGQM